MLAPSTKGNVTTTGRKTSHSNAYDLASGPSSNASASAIVQVTGQAGAAPATVPHKTDFANAHIAPLEQQRTASARTPKVYRRMSATSRSRSPRTRRVRLAPGREFVRIGQVTGVQTLDSELGDDPPRVRWRDRLTSVSARLETLAEAEREQLPLWLPVGLMLGIGAWFYLPDEAMDGLPAPPAPPRSAPWRSAPARAGAGRSPSSASPPHRLRESGGRRSAPRRRGSRASS